MLPSRFLRHGRPNALAPQYRAKSHAVRTAALGATDRCKRTNRVKVCCGVCRCRAGSALWGSHCAFGCAEAEEVHWIGARRRFDLGHAHADQPKAAAVGGLIDQRRHVLPNHIAPLRWMRQAPAATQDAEIRGLELEDDAATGHALARELPGHALAQVASNGA